MTSKQIDYQPLSAGDVTVRDRFWGRYADIVRGDSIPYLWRVLNDAAAGAPPSHAMENYRIAAGRSKGGFRGCVFQDSDVTKWLEGAALSLMGRVDEQLEAWMEKAVELIQTAQQPDGYLNTYFTLEAPGMRWRNLQEGHELYCAGHLIEAAVADYLARGESRLLTVARRFADLIAATFGPEPGKLHGYGGHPEIELALVKLYEVTGERRYLDTARYFLDARGQEPYYCDEESRRRGGRAIDNNLMKYGRAYSQAHLPLRQQTRAEGHAVRALYLYCGMADVARHTGDDDLRGALKALWRDIVERKLYITGAVGASEYGEAFSVDYDLPSDRAYGETCASVALMMLARRLLRMELKGEYGDVMERALYNVVLGGMALNGQGFFYVNPLEVYPELCARRDTRHVLPQRQKWFACSCCPPNVVRTLMDLAGYAYSQGEDTLNIHLFVGGEARFCFSGRMVKLLSEGDYLRDGVMRYRFDMPESARFTVNVRIPSWCDRPALLLNGRPLEGLETENGYARVSRRFQPGDTLTVKLPMSAHVMRSNPRVRGNLGKVCYTRGPLVYCAEERDNGPLLNTLRVDSAQGAQARYEEGLLGGVTTLTVEGDRVRPAPDAPLYTRDQPLERSPCAIKLIPYYAWSNRGENEMRVWIEEKGRESP